MADFQELYDQIYAQLAAPTVNAYTPSKSQLASEIAAYLRPQYDQAIAARRDQTIENRASIDTDAASRGMGRSTWVTDVKDRAMDAEASDIANLESNYQSALSQAVQEQFNQARANKLAADQFNASAVASAKGKAYQLAMSQSKSGGGGGSDPEISASMMNTAKKIADWYKNSKNATPEQKKKLLANYIDSGYYDKTYGKGMGELIGTLLG